MDMGFEQGQVSGIQAASRFLDRYTEINDQMRAAHKARNETAARIAISLAADETQVPYLQDRIIPESDDDIIDYTVVLSSKERSFLPKAEGMIGEILKGKRG